MYVWPPGRQRAPNASCPNHQAACMNARRDASMSAGSSIVTITTADVLSRILIEITTMRKELATDKGTSSYSTLLRFVETLAVRVSAQKVSTKSPTSSPGVKGTAEWSIQHHGYCAVVALPRRWPWQEANVVAGNHYVGVLSRWLLPKGAQRRDWQNLFLTPNFR